MLALSDPRFEAIDRGLAVAGTSGTLTGRLAGESLQGVLRAKTAYIDDVTGLAGVVDDDEHLRFAFIANDSFSAAARSRPRRPGRSPGRRVSRAAIRFRTWSPAP